VKLVPLAIEALGPLAFPERKPGVQFRLSLPYVPGAAIYGALGMLLGPGWSSEQEFAALFRSIRCHNAYPAFDGDPWVRPLPMTAIEPKGGKDDRKRCPGDDPNPIRLPYDDSLYDRVCWEQQQPAALIDAPADSEGRPWEAVGRKFYALEDQEHQPWLPGEAVEKNLAHAYLATREVSQRVLTRVAINRRRGTAEDQRLYSPLVLSETMEGHDKQLVQTRFLGSVAIPDDDTRILEALKRITHIGGRQTTGIGAVAIQPDQLTSQEDRVAALQRRVKLMNQRFRQQATFYSSLGGTELKPGTIFTINLLSDAILYEQGWLPTNEFSTAQLGDLTGVDATLLRSFTTTTTAGGWNVSWQRPKPTAIATAMGSLFVFQVANGLNEADCQKLADLERSGIGERRSEGYGQVRICDEFHLLQPTVSLEEA
jgi:CRISPR-associated protein Csx10